MEGFDKQEIKLRPTDESEKIEGREEKKRRAEISVRSIFDKHMETSGVIRRVVEDNKLSFSGREERN